MLSVVLSLKFTSVSIDGKDSEVVPIILKALMERFINLAVEYDFLRLAIRGRYLVGHYLSLYSIQNQQ